MTPNTEVPNGSVRSTIGPNSRDHPGQIQEDKRSTGGQGLNATAGSELGTRLRLAWATIQSVARRRCASGVMRTCRELTECLDRFRQLLAYVETPTDLDAVNELIAEIERRRAELSDGGQLARAVRQDREERAIRRRNGRQESPSERRIWMTSSLRPARTLPPYDN